MEFLFCIIAAWTCGVVSVIVVVCGVCCCPVYVSVCVLCLTVLVNCLLNNFAICVGKVHVFSYKVIVLFCWLIRLWSSKGYVCCVCESMCVVSVIPVCVYFICQICVFV